MKQQYKPRALSTKANGTHYLLARNSPATPYGKDQLRRHAAMIQSQQADPAQVVPGPPPMV